MTSLNSNVILYLNALNKTITYKNITKLISDSFWEKNFIPVLYPMWDSDRDRLEIFSYSADGSVYIAKNKYVKDFKTGEFTWTSYEFPSQEIDRQLIEDLFEKLKELFNLYQDKENFDLSAELRAQYNNNAFLSWGKINIIKRFLLQDSDWVMLEDVVIDPKEKEMWIKYRQKVREIKTDFTDVAISPWDTRFPITPKHYVKYELTGEYLEEEDHYYILDSFTLSHFTERMVNYITVSVMTKTIDDIEVTRIVKDRSMQNPTLDDLLRAIETDTLEFKE